MKPQQAFGGDDNSGNAAPPPPKKKLSLDRFGLPPDTNIRDVFWKLMGSYAATKKPGMDLETITGDRFAIVRSAVSLLKSRTSNSYGLAPKFIAIYTIMLCIDGGWTDAFAEFLAYCTDEKVTEEAAAGLKKVITNEKYVDEVTKELAGMIRDPERGKVALEYVARLKNTTITGTIKKELIIIARGDVGQNQINAMDALSLIKEDKEVKETFIALLSHWDGEVRKEAVAILKGFAKDNDVKGAAERRIPFETDTEIKKILEKIAGK